MIETTNNSKEEIQKNRINIPNISSNEKINKIIEEIENPEEIAKNIIYFINTTRENYDKYA